MPAWYVTTMFERLAAHRDRIALRYRGQTLSYEELLAGVYRTAFTLERRGLVRGDGIVVVAGNRPEAFIARLAAYLLGLRHVSVLPNSKDLAGIVADAQAKAVVFHPADEVGPDFGTPITLRLDEDLSAESADPIEVRAHEEDIARVLYTDGTTGQPKGVPSSYAALGSAARHSHRVRRRRTTRLGAHSTTRARRASHGHFPYSTSGYAAGQTGQEGAATPGDSPAVDLKSDGEMPRHPVQWRLLTVREPAKREVPQPGQQ